MFAQTSFLTLKFEACMLASSAHPVPSRARHYHVDGCTPHVVCRICSTDAGTGGMQAYRWSQGRTSQRYHCHHLSST